MSIVFIIGFTKCATTSLHDALCNHSGIVVPRNKEPHYYFSKHKGVDFLGEADSDFVKQEFITNRSDYLESIKYSKNSSMISIDSSAMSVSSIDIVKEMNTDFPNSKFLVLTRNATERAFSAYSHLLRDSRENLSFTDALDHELGGGRDQYLPIWHYLDSSIYDARLYKLEIMLRNRLLHIEYEKLISNQEHCLNEIQSFLGLEHEMIAMPRSNKSGIPYFPSFNKFVKRDSKVKSIIKNCTNKKVRKSITSMLSDINIGEKPRMSTEDKNKYLHMLSYLKNSGADRED